MLKFLYISIIPLFLFFSCQDSISVEVINSDFRKSLKKNTKKESIIYIDSLIENKIYRKTKLAILYFEKGNRLTIQQSYTEALKCFNFSLEHFDKEKDKIYLGELYWHLGSTNAFLSNVEKASVQLLIALEYSKELNDLKLKSNVYTSLAHTYFLLQEYQEAIEYTIQAIDIQIVEKDTLGLSSTYNNLAVIYRNINKNEEALKYNIISLDLSILKKDTGSIAKSYNNLGLVSELLNNNEKAEDYYFKAIKLNELSVQYNASPFINLGNYYFKNNKIDNAFLYYSKALNFITINGSNKKQLEMYNILLNISLNKKDYKKSLFFQQKMDSLNIIIARKNTEGELNHLENQHILASNKKDLKQAKNLNQKNIIISGIILFAVALLGLYWFQLLKNQKLKNEKEIIYLEQKVLRSQMNPHFIFNALSSIQNSLLDNEPIKSASYLSKFAKLIRQNFDFINQKTIILADELEALKNYMDMQKIRFNDKFTYEINVSEHINIEMAEIPPLLLQPFIENSIEHGFKNQKNRLIIVNISKYKNSICYEIIDNGKGYTILKNDNKIHSIDVFKKRLQLFGKNEAKSFIMNSTKNGTNIKFCLKND